MPRKNRDYKQEYADYHGKPKQKKNRALRNRARKLLADQVGPGQEVDHKVPLSKGGGSGRSNLRVTSREANRKKYNK